ncbi:thiol:disulfide interchange protein DsbA [Andreprevotia lacus DSM 23236]|jgi:thiol:disulfide interchange protein DsbA|uniref:Thiol:disulfide interchange protein n=1 Tax=Andreprevotia lacus DSM 23236 TaxID=1121001 RepID=A0A1W1XVH8_9NEIS|nr:thiol:disulfide interchange protein DsbA/DsbL [Andreprevotia lacus]SMC27538.1 thiol:disulfide interchange protein DsbA [Andreprevotia lacus DSM 23236]
MFKRWLAAAGLIAAFIAGGAHAEVREGTDYTKLTAPQPVAQAGKLEVIEFFWYGCPHCFRLEPAVEEWAAKLPKDVNFRRVHVYWPGRNDIEAHAKIFLALQNMGVEGKYQQAVFNAIQKDGLELRRDDTLFDWAKKQGIDVAKFKANYNTFSTAQQLKQLDDMGRTYAIEGVPTLIINGKYKVSGREDAGALDVVNELLAKERAAAKPAAAATKKKK